MEVTQKLARKRGEIPPTTNKTRQEIRAGKSHNLPLTRADNNTCVHKSKPF